MGSSSLRSTLLVLAVALAAAGPASAISNGHAENRARAHQLPARHVLDRNETGNSLSRRYYGSRGGALMILWSNGLKTWRPSTKIVASKRYHAGDTIVIPKPPKASIHPPRRATQP
jgi:hypothetical protein